MDFHKALAKTGLFGCKGREDDSNNAEGKPFMYRLYTCDDRDCDDWVCVA